MLMDKSETQIIQDLKSLKFNPKWNISIINVDYIEDPFNNRSGFVFDVSINDNRGTWIYTVPYGIKITELVKQLLIYQVTKQAYPSDIFKARLMEPLNLKIDMDDLV